MVMLYLYRCCGVIGVAVGIVGFVVDVEICISIAVYTYMHNPMANVTPCLKTL